MKRVAPWKNRRHLVQSHSERYNELIMTKYPSTDDDERNYQRPSTVETAKTAAHISNTGTLSYTTNINGSDATVQFGRFVYYSLDDKGWPILLFPFASNEFKNGSAVSLCCDATHFNHFDSSVALGRVTFSGTISTIHPDNLFSTKNAFLRRCRSLTSSIESPTAQICKLKPSGIYFVKHSGRECWLDVTEYEMCENSLLADDLCSLVNKYNTENKKDLQRMCKHIIGENVSPNDQIRVLGIDKFGINIQIIPQIISDPLFATNEYSSSTECRRVGFENRVHNVEDVKSELAKIFQESWEKEQSLLSK